MQGLSLKMSSLKQSNKQSNKQTVKPLFHADALPIVAGEFSFRAGRKLDPFNLVSYDKDFTI